MLTTAKNIQLLDQNGINISPLTDITSLYYEVEERIQNSSVITRKYVYSGFPVGVYIDPSITTNIGTATSANFTYQNNSTPFYLVKEKITNNNLQDIIVSNVSTSIIKGTTYRQINIKNYNLTEILGNYTTKELFNSSINEVNNTLNNQEIRINNIYDSIVATECPLSVISSMIRNNTLIPNKFYLVNNYYIGSGCMKIPNNNSSIEFDGPHEENGLSVLIRANSTSSLDYKVYNIYDKNNNPLNVHGQYELMDNLTKLKITYLKDQYGNEAPYDFYNLKFKKNRKKNRDVLTYTFNCGDMVTLAPYGDGNLLLLNDSKGRITNNIIKYNPFIENPNNIFSINIHYAEPDIFMHDIKNNQFGDNTTLIIYCLGGDLCNNYIENNCNIVPSTIYGGEMCISNSIIGNNNSIIYAGGYSYNKLIIGNNNTIKFNNSITNGIIINSENNITINNNKSNCIILNNNKGTINLSDNVIIDQHTTNTALSPQANSIFLYNQNVYAKSFNSLK